MQFWNFAWWNATEDGKTEDVFLAQAAGVGGWENSSGCSKHERGEEENVLPPTKFLNLPQPNGEIAFFHFLYFSPFWRQIWRSYKKEFPNYFLWMGQFCLLLFFYTVFIPQYHHHHFQYFFISVPPAALPPLAGDGCGDIFLLLLFFEEHLLFASRQGIGGRASAGVQVGWNIFVWETDFAFITLFLLQLPPRLLGGQRLGGGRGRGGSQEGGRLWLKVNITGLSQKQSNSLAPTSPKAFL